MLKQVLLTANYFTFSEKTSSEQMDQYTEVNKHQAQFAVIKFKFVFAEH